MSTSTIRNVAVAAGLLTFTFVFVISPVLGVVLAVILLGAFYLAYKVAGKSEVRVEAYRKSELLDRMWLPIRSELAEVVRTGGNVTGPASVWTTVPNLFKHEAPAIFHRGMERYVNQRRRVVSTVASVSTTDKSRRPRELEQQRLLAMSRELLQEVRSVIDKMPETARAGPSATPEPETPPPAPAPLGKKGPAETSVQPVREPPRPYRPAVSPARLAEASQPPGSVVAGPAHREQPGELRLDVASVCETLFDPKLMSYETNRLFDNRYKGATVHWKGTVRRANVYSYDSTFREEGTRAEFDVHEVKQTYGSRPVKAFVQLPKEAAEAIGARIGEEASFEGRLLTCEGSARRLYVADARIVD